MGATRPSQSVALQAFLGVAALTRLATAQADLNGLEPVTRWRRGDRRPFEGASLERVRWRERQPRRREQGLTHEGILFFLIGGHSQLLKRTAEALNTDSYTT